MSSTPCGFVSAGEGACYAPGSIPGIMGSISPQCKANNFAATQIDFGKTVNVDFEAGVPPFNVSYR